MINKYEDFKAQFIKLSGIDLSSYKETQMKRRIDNFIAKNNCSGYGDFLILLKKDKSVYDSFITYLTINVSEFYRNPAQWKTLESQIIPFLLKNRTRKRFRIWSAACSTGDEPYTLAMVMSDFLPLSQVEIIATDMDNEVLSKARAGVYIEKSLKGLPGRYVKQYFTKDENNLFHVSNALKGCITFKQHNLLRDPYPRDIDLLVCRNVLIYFTEEAKAGIYREFVKSLTNSGVLFVGSTEQIIGCAEFGLDTFHSFFYRKH